MARPAGTRAVAALIVIGVALPPIGALIKPFVTEAVFIPALFGASYLTLGLKDQSPDLFFALVLQAIAPPLMAAPALAALPKCLMRRSSFAPWWRARRSCHLVAFAVLGLTALLFVSTGRDRALTLGFTAAERNTGLMLAATAGALPELSWLYFAFSYLPMYLLPLLLQPLTRRKVAAARTKQTPPPSGPAR